MSPQSTVARAALRTLAAMVAAIPVLAAGVARADDLTFRPGGGGFEVLDGERVVAVVPLPGSPVYDLARAGSVLWVARGENGVTAFDISTPTVPVELRTIATQRAAVKLAVGGGSLVVVVAEYGALAYDITNPRQPVATRLERALAPLVIAAPAAPATAAPAGAPGAAAAPAAPSKPASPPRGIARVTALRNGWLYIEADGPIHRGDGYVILGQQPITSPDPATGAPVERPANKPQGGFVVEEVKGQVGAGPLAKGTIARVGDIAQPVEPAPSPAIQFPRLWGGMTRVTALARPFLPVGQLGFGMVSELSLDHYFVAPVRLGVQMNPIGLIAIGPGTGVSSELHLRVAYSGDFFEIGLLPGIQFQNYDAGGRFSLAYGLRVGALDGLSFTFQNSYTVETVADGASTRSRFRFENAFGEIAIPVHQRVTLLLEGGGGRTVGWGMLGVRGYLRGGGGPGTIVLRTAVGGAWVQDQLPSSYQNGMYVTGAGVSGAGPAISLGVDARF